MYDLLTGISDGSVQVFAMASMASVGLRYTVNLPALAGVAGTGAILASLLFIAGAFAIGRLLGGAFGDDLRDELALGTSQRNFAAALVVATQSFEAPGVLVMSVVVSLATMAVLFPAAKLLNRRACRQSTGSEIENPGRLRPLE